MKIWLDDVRPAPEGKGYIEIKSVDIAKDVIQYSETMVAFYQPILANDETPEQIRKSIEQDLREVIIELIDIDHDAGDYVSDGGDYIKLLDWLEETGRNYSIHIHSQNVVGVENMRRIIKRNGWREI